MKFEQFLAFDLQDANLRFKTLLRVLNSKFATMRRFVKNCTIVSVACNRYYYANVMGKSR